MLYTEATAKSMLYIYIAIGTIHLITFWWLWARTKKRMFEKLYWSLILLIPVVGLLIFYAFQDPPSSHPPGWENGGENSNF